MLAGFDSKELSKFQNNLVKLAQKEMPKESKKFLREQGTKLRKETVTLAKSRTDKKTGNLYKGIKKGKVYVFRGSGALSIRVYGGKPAYHVHLLEYGHRQVDKDGKEGKFVKGKHFFRDAANSFENQHYNDVQKFLDATLEKGLS